jgi:hypothetical protein
LARNQAFLRQLSTGSGASDIDRSRNLQIDSKGPKGIDCNISRRSVIVVQKRERCGEALYNERGLEARTARRAKWRDTRLQQESYASTADWSLRFRLAVNPGDDDAHRTNRATSLFNAGFSV